MIALIGFDAVGAEPVERMLAAGKLPALASALARGRRIELETPADRFPAAAYTEMYTGVRLGRHGVHYPFQWSPEAQRVAVGPAQAPPPAAWERLAADGRRSLVIDPYEIHPPAHTNGLVVSGWQLLDRVVLRAWSRPEAARGELVRRHGRPTVVGETFGRSSPRELLRIRRALLDGPARVASLAEEQLASDSFDLAWIGFASAHLAGHLFWDLSEVDAEHATRGELDLIETALEEIYVATDAALGRVLESLPGGTDAIVASPLGMAANTSRADLLPQMLERVLGEVQPTDEQEGGQGFLWRLRGAVPTDLRATVARRLPDRVALELAARLDTRGIDWARTPAFAAPSDSLGYIRLNRRGRERDGIVEPGAVDELIGRIEAGLASFSDIGGGPCVARVERVADAISGERAGDLPDLVVHWSEVPATGLAGVRSGLHGEVRRHAGSGRSGNHPPRGAWAVLLPAAATAVEIGRSPATFDLATTALALGGAGADQLAEVDGVPLLAR